MANVIMKFFIASLFMWITPITLLHGFNHNWIPGKIYWYDIKSSYYHLCGCFALVWWSSFYSARLFVEICVMHPRLVLCWCRMVFLLISVIGPSLEWSTAPLTHLTDWLVIWWKGQLSYHLSKSTLHNTHSLASLKILLHITLNFGIGLPICIFFSKTTPLCICNWRPDTNLPPFYLKNPASSRFFFYILIITGKYNTISAFLSCLDGVT